MQLKMIDQQFCRRNRACYTDEKLFQLFDRPMTIEEVLTRTDGAWSDVSGLDRIWVFVRAVQRKQLLNWLTLLVERALRRINKPDPRSVAVIEAIRNDSVSTEIYEAAYADAAAAAAYAAAYDAAAAAAGAAAYAAAAAAAADAAAYTAADAAANAAVYAATYAAAAANAAVAAVAGERKQQIEDALNVLKEDA